MTGSRTARVAQEMQHEVARILQQEFKDPRLGFVTVTRLDLSKDFSHARVLYSCLGDGQARALSQAALAHAAPYVRSLLKKRFRLKVIPVIEFRYDESIAGAIEIERVIQDMNRESPP